MIINQNKKLCHWPQFMATIIQHCPCNAHTELQEQQVIIPRNEFHWGGSEGTISYTDIPHNCTHHSLKKIIRHLEYYCMQWSMSISSFALSTVYWILEPETCFSHWCPCWHTLHPWTEIFSKPHIIPLTEPLQKSCLRTVVRRFQGHPHGTASFPGRPLLPGWLWWVISPQSACIQFPEIPQLCSFTATAGDSSCLTHYATNNKFWAV